MKIAIVLEALTGSFITDMDKAGREAKKQADQMRREWERTGKAIGGALAAGVALAGTALVAWTKQTIDATRQIERLAKVAGTSNTTFQRWAVGAREAGIEQEKLADILKDVQDKVGDFLQTGGGAMADFFENIAPAVGVTAEQFRNLSGPAALQLYVDSLEKANLSQSEMAFYMEAIASDTTALLPLLRNGGEAMRKYGDEAERAGAIMSDEVIESTKELQRITREMDQQFTAFKTNLVVELIPTIEELANQINSPEFKAGFGIIAEGAITAAAKVAELLVGIGNLTRFVAEEAAARIFGPSIDDIVRIEDAIKRQKKLIEEIEAKEARGTNRAARSFSRFAQPSDIVSLKAANDELERLEELLKAAQKAAEDAAKAKPLEPASVPPPPAGTTPVVITELDRKAAEAARKAAEAARKQAEAFAAANRELDRWAAELLPAADRAAAEYNIRVQEMIAEQQAGKMTADQLARALGILGTQYQRNAREIAKNNDVLGRIKQSYAEQAGAVGLTGRELAAYHAVLEATRDAHATFGDELADMPGYLEQVQDAAREGATGLYDMQQEALDLENILARFDDIGMSGLVRDIALVKKELAEATDEARIAELENALASMNTELAIGSIEGFRSLLGAVQGFSKEGSKSFQQIEQAMAALSVVQAALATADAVRAILSAAAAPWPLNFSSMAAMANAVAPLLSAIGAALPAFSGSGGPSANSATYRQEHQGTGTVLGDASAKSESIARATEITASATQQLVGINRSMLNALQAMQAGISGASGMLARGTRGPDISLSAGLGSALSGIPIVGNLLGGLVSSIFGGKESLRDQGIRIVGGYLSSMIDDILVQSYASIHRSGGWFRSSRDYDRFETLGDDVATQFSLVLGSMVDAVRAAADTLGLNMDAINAAIAAYRIEEIRISTMDLSAEEAQAELAAVFSSIFDGLAGAVVPFIAQFQQVGEGLGETLIRVATGVQVTQEAVIQLGFALDETDPEKFAQISEGLMELMGGIDGFIEGMSSFVNAFATDEHKFAVAQDALTRAFEQFGLSVPESRDAMWDLMQGLDATTEAGREQIAMLLQLADVSDAYYSMLEDQAAAMARINDAIASGAWEQYLDTLEDGQRAIVELTKHYDDWRDSLIAAGATTEQLAAVETQRAVALERLLAAAEAEYQSAAQSIADQLAIARGATDYMQEMVRIERQYQDQVQALNAHARAAGRASASERDLANALELATIQRAKALMQLEQEAAALAGQLRMSALDAQIAQLSEIEGAATSAMTGFADAIGDAGRAAAEAMGLLLGSYSPLRASDKLPIALQALQRGETDANTVLQIARDVYASGAAYNAIFDQVMAITQSSGRDVGGGSGSTRVSAEMQALLDQRAELEAQQAQRDLFTQSSQLAAMIAELSSARGEDYDAIANLLQYDLSQLATDLGLDGLGALTEYLDNVAKEQASIADLFDLPTAGDLEIVGAISDLTDAIVGADFAPEDIPPIGDIPENARDTEQQDQLAADTREMVTLLRAMVERGLPASEDTATAAERLVDAVERIGDVIESDGGAALAAETRRGG